MFSIYSVMFNLENSFLDWQGALGNFSCFADEVVISTLPNDFEILRDYIQNFLIERHKIKIVVNPDISLDDPFFDGKLKNAALKKCGEPFCILLDADERIDSRDKNIWINWANYLASSPSCEALLIPVIDLYNSDKEYKSIGVKWYLHKNLPHLHRGVVSFAKKSNGKINTNESDTCELLSFDDNLCYGSYVTTNMHPEYIKTKCIPKIWHLGWSDKDKRLKANSFWKPVWENRAGHSIDNIIDSKDKLDKIEYFKHGMKLWYE